MRPSGGVALTLALVAAGCGAPWPEAGSQNPVAVSWISAEAPACEPVALYWFEVERCPLVYEAKLRVPVKVGSASALARSAGYLYVYVDGQQVYAWPPPVLHGQEETSVADAERVHEIDLGRALSRGSHVVTVSAPAEGFALFGSVFGDRVKAVASFASDGTWSVAALPATTVFGAGQVAALHGEGASRPVWRRMWPVEQRPLNDAERRFADSRRQEDRVEAQWRLELLRDKGIYIVDGVARGAARGRLPGELRHEAERLDEALRGGEPATALLLAIEGLSARAFESDEALALELLASEVDSAGSAVGAAEDVARLRTELTRGLGHPTNHLNESRYDRLGWAPLDGLADDVPDSWGIWFGRKPPLPQLQVTEGWRFAPDARDQGIQERRWATDYNTADQWALVDLANADSGWISHGPTPRYRGVAWYRKNVYVPEEWFDREINFSLRVSGRLRVWWNGTELEPMEVEGESVFRVDPELVEVNAENLIAVRVRAKQRRARGLLGAPRFEHPEENELLEASPVEVITSRLSPVVRLRAPTRELVAFHHGQLEVGRWNGAGLTWAIDYRRDRDGDLLTNWVVLRRPGGGIAGDEPGLEGPLLLIFERNPTAIEPEQGRTRLALRSESARTVRPFGSKEPASWADAEVQRRLTLWSRAALAVPTDYMSVTRLLEPGGDWRRLSLENPVVGPLLGQTVVYAYADMKDAWDTRALRIAPLPAMASYALDRQFPGLKVEAVEVLHPGGALAPYRGARDSDRVSYSYRIEPFPRLAGFTTWMHAHGDAGVPGNERELELLASIGANSLRAQHNSSDEPPTPGSALADDGRSRVEILADFSRAVGVNYMSNPEQALGRPRESVREDYDGLVRRLQGFYDRLLPQLADRPFFEVAYDLVNEPFDHLCGPYNRMIADLTDRIRATDSVHLLVIEPCETWSALEQIVAVERTGDPLTLYSFHDYGFRLDTPEQRWPTLQGDLSSIYRRWLPAIRYQIDNAVPLHCGEFGDFAGSTYASPAQTLLLNDLLLVLDQYGMHHHYYSGRALFLFQADGSLLPTNVARAFRDYFARPDFNQYYFP